MKSTENIIITQLEPVALYLKTLLGQDTLVLPSVYLLENDSSSSNIELWIWAGEEGVLLTSMSAGADYVHVLNFFVSDTERRNKLEGVRISEREPDIMGFRVEQTY